MSLPSIRTITQELNIDLAQASDDDIERVLVAAMQRDLPLGVAYLHQIAHESMKSGTTIFGNEDPNSPLGKEIVRISAGTVLREIAQKHFCHGLHLSFLNCCGPVMGVEPPLITKLMRRQIEMQDGTIAHADC